MATTQNTLTVLCIDSGGVKGIIPAVMLEYLESQLQVIDGSNARLAHYFDVIAGSGTGGLITAMITAPKPYTPKQPLYMANQIIPIFKTEFPKILPQPRPACTGVPVYKGDSLDGVGRDTFGATRLNETLTNVLIPVYETQILRPIFFSNELAKKRNSLDALLSDICIGGLSAYPWLAAYNFKNGTQEFNVVDGSVIAPNPALIALTELIRKEKNKGLKFNRVVMISLGTCGASPTSGAGWTSAQINGMNQQQILDASRSMLGKFTATVNAYTIDYQLEVIFRAYGSLPNYLRIYEDDLTKAMDEVDLATPANMNNLETYARNLLNKPMTGTGDNPANARVLAGSGETYAQALKRFAKTLSQVKKARSTA